jgi:hypothetical protein
MKKRGKRHDKTVKRREERQGRKGKEGINGEKKRMEVKMRT